ncbi:hypothetical protein QUA62_28360 [Microcoleus sp. MON1_C1]|uniref:hypothetical protein n=1 Tax=Microcoleus sp. MON1_C1 TaxID=2818827 RepID=UPI002FD2BDE8
MFYEIREAVVESAAAEFIETLPELRAVKTYRAGSGNARAIARTLVTKAPILILNELKNALDLKHEQ